MMILGIVPSLASYHDVTIKICERITAIKANNRHHHSFLAINKPLENKKAQKQQVILLPLTY